MIVLGDDNLMACSKKLNTTNLKQYIACYFNMISKAEYN